MRSTPHPKQKLCSPCLPHRVYNNHRAYNKKALALHSRETVCMRFWKLGMDGAPHSASSLKHCFGRGAESCVLASTMALTGAAIRANFIYVKGKSLRIRTPLRAALQGCA